MSDTATEGEVIYKAQQAAIDRGRIESLVARVESLEMRLAGLARYSRETISTLSVELHDCQGRLASIEARLSDDGK